MKNVVIFILAFVFLISCASRELEHKLLDIESYIAARPDSALKVLDSIDRDLLSTRELRSHHALLHAMALDKNYIDVSDDSLAMTALDWFDRHGDKKYKVRSLYYLGLSYYYSKEYDKAIIELTKAENLAPSCDSLYWGMTKSLQGHVYSRTYNHIEEMNCVQKAYEIYSALSLDYYTDITRYRQAQILMNDMEYDTAERIYLELLDKEGLSNYTMGNTLCSYAYLNVIKQDTPPEKIILLYEDLFNRFGNQYMTIKDWWAYTSVLNKLGRYEESQNLIEQLESVDTSSTPYYWKYFMANDVGNKELALKYLEKSTLYDNKVISSALSQSLALAQRNYYEIQSENSEYRVKVRTQMLLIILFCSLLIITLLIVIICTRHRKYREEKDKYIQYVDEVTRQLSEIKNDDLPSLKKKYLEAYKSKFENLRVLCDNYLQFQGRDNAEKSMYSKVVSMVNELRTDMQDHSKLEAMLNADLNGIMDSVRNEFKLKEVDYIILSYLIIGFDATTISRLIDSSVNTVYIRKSRIKRMIEDSDSSIKCDLLDMIS